MSETHDNTFFVVSIILEALMFKKSIIITLISTGFSISGANAGIFGYTLNKLTDSGQPAVSNPCKNESFNKKYGKFCSGIFTKTIRCLSEGGNPGVCDSSAVCDTLDRTAKNLCETHCLNTDPKNMGNQAIKISCSPKPNIHKNHKMISFNPFEEGRIGTLNERGDKSDVQWIDAGTRASSAIDPNLPSIRDKDEGDQDSQNSGANFYETEHPKSFDEINTEKPWEQSSFDFLGSYPLGVATGSGGVIVGGRMQRQQEQHQYNSNQPTEKRNPRENNDNEGFSSYPLDEVDQPYGFHEETTKNHDDESTNRPKLNAQGSDWVRPADYNGYTKTSYQGILEDRFFTMPD